MSTPALIRRFVFLFVMVGLAFLNISLLFRGLEHPKAMEQAQIAREIARGNGFQSNVIKPIALSHSLEAGEQIGILEAARKDTYHAPLYPYILSAVLKIAGGDDADKWRMGNSDTVYELDRIIAAISLLCFLMAIGVNYLLLSRIFDTKIGGVVAVMMLLSDTFWQFSISGLPQMMMLLLFSLAMLFAYRATEITTNGLSATGSALAAAIFFALLALTHWLATWILIGYCLYAIFFIRPKGIAAIFTLFFFAIPAGIILAQYHRATGVLGIGYYSIYNGVGGISEDLIMRTTDAGQIISSNIAKGILLNIASTVITQLKDLYANTGGVLAASAFFFALIHNFKRPGIRDFRWCVLATWVLASIGMAIFGLQGKVVSYNQLHILFTPLAAGYGLAFITLIWNRIPFPENSPGLKNAHFVILIALGASSLVIDIPQKFVSGLYSKGAVPPHWRPYYPTPLNTKLASWVDEKEIIVSDQPWAVGWYADRKALWLPRLIQNFEKIEKIAALEKTPFAGIHLSPYSSSMKPLPKVQQEYKGYFPLILNGWAAKATRQTNGNLVKSDPRTRAVFAEYLTNYTPMVGPEMVYYSATPIRSRK